MYSHDLPAPLPGFDVHAAGYTPVEVSPQGMDKGYPVEILLGIVETHVTRTVYVADGFHDDGSDVPVALLGGTQHLGPLRAGDHQGARPADGRTRHG